MYTDMDFSNNNFITSDRNENCNNSIEIVYKEQEIISILI